MKTRQNQVTSILSKGGLRKIVLEITVPEGKSSKHIRKIMELHIVVWFNTMDLVSFALGIDNLMKEFSSIALKL